MDHINFCAVEAADKLPAELSNQAGSAISILATEMEASADHAPFCNQLQQKGPESKEVNVLQVFIDTESVFSGGQGRLPNQLPGENQILKMICAKF